jgi:hypothetical protein
MAKIATKFTLASIIFVLLVSVFSAGCQTAAPAAQDASVQTPDTASPTGDAAPAPKNDGVVTYEYYTFETDDMKIKYPSNWTKREDIPGTTVVFQSTSGIFSVGIKDLGQDVALDDFSAWNVDQKNKTVDGFTLVGFANTTLSGEPARSLVFTGKMESDGKEAVVKRVQIWTIYDGKAYMLEYVISVTKDGKEQKYDLFKLRKIASTFTLKGSAGEHSAADDSSAEDSAASAEVSDIDIPLRA